MYNLGVHWIDLYRWLLEDEIVEVVGKNVRVGQEHNIEDNSFAIATFGSGTTLSLDISYTVPDSYPFGRDLYLGLRGTEGCINFAPSFEGLRQTMFVCSNNPKFGGAPRQTINFELENVPGYSGSCGLEYVSQIARSIIGRSEPPVSGDDAVRALRVVEAIYESDKSGKSIKVKYD